MAPTTMSLHALLARSRLRLKMAQREFGPALGASHRTATRWDSGKSTPIASQLRRLVDLLLPVDRDLAAEAAAHMGETLQSLGLEPAPAAPWAPPVPAGPPPTAPRDLADIVVCAVAEAADQTPRAVRPWVYAAFRRASEVGLSVKDVEQALAPEAKT